MPAPNRREDAENDPLGYGRPIATGGASSYAGSAALLRSLGRLERFARCDGPILLTGESGTGKTYFAEWAHTRSARSRGPFHRVNLAALDDSIVGSELFGHVQGAYTDARGTRAGAFVTSHHGTLFLDEFGKASLATQQRLLDVLERGVVRPLGSDREVRVDVRLILAANERLEELVRIGRMLPDLLSRLGYLRVEIPPLRERRPEIPGLIREFVRRYAAGFGWPHGESPEVADDLLVALARCDWRDNVRGLENLVIRLLADAAGTSVLSAALLVDDLAEFSAPMTDRLSRVANRLREIQAAIARHGGNCSRAARDLGMSRSRLYDYLRMVPEPAVDPDP